MYYENKHAWKLKKKNTHTHTLHMHTHTHAHTHFMTHSTVPVWLLDSMSRPYVRVSADGRSTHLHGGK